jgi:hypothetical protein
MFFLNSSKKNQHYQVVRLFKLKKGQKFWILHGEHIETDSPWWVMWQEAEMTAICQHESCTSSETTFINSNIDVVIELEPNYLSLYHSRQQAGEVA